MKMKEFLMATVFAFMLSYCFTNCKGYDLHYENGVASVSYYYHWHLSFQDSTGVDLVKALEKNMFVPGLKADNTYSIEDNNLFGYVDTLLYTLDVIFPEWYDPDYCYNQMILNGNIPAPVSPFQIHLHKNIEEDKFFGYFDNAQFGYYYLHFNSAATDIFGKEGRIPPVETLTCKLTCPLLFGDNEVHEIVSCWDTKHWVTNGAPVCYRVLLDGKEFEINKGFVTIILDRTPFNP